MWRNYSAPNTAKQMHVGVGRGVVHHPGLAGERVGRGRAQGLGRRESGQPGLEGGGLEREIQETRPGDGDLGERGDFRGQGGDQSLGGGARILLRLLGVGEDAVGLEVSMLGGCHAHIGRKESEIETGGGGCAFEARVERGGEMKLGGHPANQPRAAGPAQAPL